jgi:hypothetical protein
LRVAFESAVVAHEFMQNLLPRVSERRVPKVVRKAHGFHQVGIRPQGQRDAFRDLRDFERMRKASAEEVAFVHAKNLGFALQATERGGMDDPSAVTLKVRTVISSCVGLFRSVPTGLGHLSWLHCCFSFRAA